MAETYMLKAEPRELTGKQVKRLRADGKIPAVLYGHGVDPQKLSVIRGEFEKVYRQAGGSSVVTIKLPDGEATALIHEAQQQPVTGHFLHIDLYKVRMDEKIKANVPLEFEGTAPAVRELDGILLTNLSEVEVECLPGDLPSSITVSIEPLEGFDDSITVEDLKLPPGVEVTNESDTTVVTVNPPRTQEELDELEEEVGEVEEPEVEGEKKAEGEEGEEGEGEGEGGEETAEADAGGDEKKPEKKSE